MVNLHRTSTGELRDARLQKLLMNIRTHDPTVPLAIYKTRHFKINLKYRHITSNINYCKHESLSQYYYHATIKGGPF